MKKFGNINPRRSSNFSTSLKQPHGLLYDIYVGLSEIEGKIKTGDTRDLLDDKFTIYGGLSGLLSTIERKFLGIE